MRKLIKKYQNPFGPIWNPNALPNPTVAAPNFLLDSVNAQSKLNFSNSLQTFASKGKFNIPNKLPTDFKSPITQSTGSLSGLGKGLGELGKGLGGQVAQMAPQLAESALGALGVQKADVQTGVDKALSGVSSMAFQAGLKTGNPFAIGAGAVLKGLDLVNQFGGKTAKKQGTVGLETGPYAFQTSTMAGKKFTMLNRGGAKRANIRTNRANLQNLAAGQASYEAKQESLAATNAFSDISERNQQNLLGGINYNILSAKSGTKINPSKLRNIANKAKKKREIQLEEIAGFKDGGKLNVIPDGALHKNLHHLDGDLGKSVTGKGIPVITYDDGGEITQHAEIERNEIIFTKSTTDMLEDFFNKYNEASDEEKNSLAIEAGKFLATEILENTDDRTGLLNEVE